MVSNSIWITTMTIVFACYDQIAGQSLGLGKCPSHPAMKTLNLKMFEGQWYEVERSFYLMEMFSSCTSLSIKAKPSGALKVTIKNINRLTGSPSVSLGTAVPIKNASAELNYRVDTKFPSAVARMMPGSGRYHVLDTDYDTYAILWSCSNLTVMHADLIWVLGRHRELPVWARAHIYNKLSELNLDSDRLILTRHKDCPDF
ncbi:apolipoprotein D [Periplaneta americana]|uniref:apolipoprotein D n=1 Tax=Periplaneta americana TaxID=6978 RepID=UPI0037E872A7